MNHNKTSHKTKLLLKLEKPMHNNEKSKCHSEVPVPCRQDPAQSKWGFPCGSAGKESACNAGDLGLIPRLGRSPGEGKGYPLQYSGLEKSMDCIVHGITKSQT